MDGVVCGAGWAGGAIQDSRQGPRKKSVFRNRAPEPRVGPLPLCRGGDGVGGENQIDQRWKAGNYPMITAGH